MRNKGIQQALLVGVMLFFAPMVWAQQTSDEATPPPRNAVVEQLQVVHRYEDNGTGEVIHTAKLRILTETGLKMYGAVYLPYASELESLQINYLRTIKADGTVIPADPSKAMDVTPPVARYAPMFSDIKIKALVAPQLQVGDSVELQYTRTIRTPYMPDNFWVMYSLDRSNPITSASIVLDVPADRKLTFQSDPCFHYTLKKENGRAVYTWEIKNLEPLDNEAPDQPPLFAASTLSSWSQVADWYTALQAKGLRVTPEIQSMADKLTAGKTTTEEKLDAIYAYVSEKIRYVALEFGIGGFQAHSAPAVLDSGYGDCKDKSGLLEALLAAEGIKAYPALVNAVKDQIYPAVPMPSQFDHVMTVVPMKSGNLWLDSTMETAPPGVLSPAVMGKQALLIEPGASHLVTVPDSPPSPPQNIIQETGSIDAAGTLTAKFNAQVTGIAGVFMRQIFRLQDKNQLKKAEKAMAQYQLDGASVSDSSNSDPDDLASPFKYQYTLTKPAYLDLLEKDEQIQLPLMFIGPNNWQRQISRAEEEQKASAKASSSSACAANPPQTIDIDGPGDNQETLDLTIPSNYKVELPQPINVERPFGSYTSSYSFDHNRLLVKRELKLNSAKIPLDQLEALRNFQNLINDDLKQQLTLHRTGNAGALSDASSMTADELNTAGQEAMEKHFNPVVARDLLLKAVAKDPKSKYAWNNLGRAYAMIGNYYQAEKAYRKQAEINPYDNYAFNNLGLTEAAQDHEDAAIADFKQQLSVNPLDQSANFNLAAAYDQKRDWSAAAAAYGASVRISPRNPLLQAAWGGDLLKSGKTDQGRQALAQALEISKIPVILNNVAYAMAQSGVDLSKAEEDARSAVDQVIPENVASLEVPKDYDGSLNSLAAFLDTLGWALFKEGKLTEAAECLGAAYEIRPSPDGARHAAMLAMRQNDPKKALLYYTFSQAQFGGKAPYSPKELKDYVQAHGGLPQMTAARVAKAWKEMQDVNRLAPPPGRHFTWPPSAGKTSAWVALNLLVDAQGHVSAAKVFRGSDPYSSAAKTDALELRFPPIAWSKHKLATVRHALFLYDPGSADPAERIQVFGEPGALREPIDQSQQKVYDITLRNEAASSFILQGHTAAGLEIIRQEAKETKDVPDIYRLMVVFARQLRRQGQLQAAAEILRIAVPLQPKDDFAHRELAETLKAAGDHAAAVSAYQDLIGMDPEDAAAHFALAGEYEAQAAPPGGVGSSAGTSKGKNGREPRMNRATKQKLDLALAQYALATKLKPENTSYRAAYKALFEKLNHSAPPAAPGAP